MFWALAENFSKSEVQVATVSLGSRHQQLRIIIII